MDTIEGRSAVLADDHDRVRAGVRALLEEMGLTVIGEGRDALDAQQLGERLKPDLLVLDFSMPGPKVGETLHHLRQCAPGTRVLILTAHDDDAFIREALAARVDGYLLKEEAPESLKDAVRAVLSGQGWFSPLVKRKFML